jgi:hypothetical protein
MKAAILPAALFVVVSFVAAGCSANDPGAITGTFPGGDPNAVMQHSTNPYASGNAPPTWGGPAGGGMQ